MLRGGPAHRRLPELFDTPWVVVVLVILISLFAHLFIHSRSARSAVLVAAHSAARHSYWT